MSNNLNMRFLQNKQYHIYSAIRSINTKAEMITINYYTLNISHSKPKDSASQLWMRMCRQIVFDGWQNGDLYKANLLSVGGTKLANQLLVSVNNLGSFQPWRPKMQHCVGKPSRNVATVCSKNFSYQENKARATLETDCPHTVLSQQQRARRDTTRQDCFVVIPAHTGVMIVYSGTIMQLSNVSSMTQYHRSKRV